MSSFAYLGLTHSHLVLVIALNRFFNTTHETIYTATVMDQYGHLGLSCLVFSMSNTIGNLCPVLSAWAFGRLLDYFGDSIECWTGILITLASLCALYCVIYVCFCDSNPINVARKDKQRKETCSTA